MSRVTLKDIATKAGVSISAVSLALSGKGNISEPQKERIRSIAEEMGYVPNPLLASLASRRFRSGKQATGTLLAVLEYPIAENLGAISQYRKHLLHSASLLGYQTRLIKWEEMHAYNDVSNTLYRCGMQGAIVTGQPPEGFFEDRAVWRHFAMVQCGRFRCSLPLHTVRSDIFRSIKLAFEALRKRGYQRIGFAVGQHHPVLEDDEARLGAALAMTHIHMAPENIVPPLMGDFEHKNGLLEWVQRERPDAIVGFSAAQYYYLREAGYRVPEDIGFAAMHLTQFAQEGPQEIAGLSQQVDIIAHESVVLIDQLIRHNIRGFPDTPRHNLIASRWVDGLSVRPQSPPIFSVTGRASPLGEF